MPPRKVKQVQVRDPNRPWWNAWYLTFNTNNTHKRFVYPLKLVFQYVASHIDEFVKDPAPGVRVLKVKQNSAVEQSPVMHRYHLHAFLAVRSTGLLDLDYYEIKRYFEKQLSQVKGFKSIAFYHKIIPGFNAAENARNYLNKAPIKANKGKSKFTLI